MDFIFDNDAIIIFLVVQNSSSKKHYFTVQKKHFNKSLFKGIIDENIHVSFLASSQLKSHRMQADMTTEL